MRRALVGLAAWALVVAGCAASSGARRADPAAGPFPNRAALQRLAATRPGGTASAAPRWVEVTRWALAGPLPETIDARPTTDDSPWTRLLREAARAQRGRVLVTEAMRCVARELGRFRLERDADPPQDLADFVAGRCGAAGVDLAHFSARADVPEAADEDDLFARWRADLAARLGEALRGDGRRLAGVWFGRRGARTVVFVAVARQLVALEPVPTVPDARGHVTLRGEVLEPAIELQAYVAQGRYGVASCAFDATVAPPRFVAVCPTAAGDPVAWIDVLAGPPGRLLVRPVLTVPVWPSRAPPGAFERPPATGADAGTDLPAAVRRLATLLNDARGRAGAPALALAEAQTALACGLVPHYVAALLGRAPPTTADVVALGLMAGWEVRGIVREGWFTSTGGAASGDLGQLLEATLQHPFARRTLLEPSASRLAVCPAITRDGAVLGVLWGTYALYDEASRGREVDRVVGRLTELRRARGHGPLQPLVQLAPAFERAATRVGAGQLEPTAALQSLMDEAAGATQGGVRGWVLQGTSPEDVEFPSELVAEPSLQAAAVVAHWRPDDAPWGRLVVFVVASSGGRFRGGTI